MARIPLTTARRSLDPGSPVNYPGSLGTGEALQGFGQQVEAAGQRMMRADEEAERYKQAQADAEQRRYDAVVEEDRRRVESIQRFETDQRAQQVLYQNQAEMPEVLKDVPASGEGLHDKTLAHFDQRNEEFLATVPEHLRDEWTARMQTRRTQLSAGAAETQFRQQTDWYRNGVDQSLQDMQNAVFDDPSTFDAAVSDFNRRVDDTGLPAAEKEERKLKAREAFILAMSARDIRDAQQTPVSAPVAATRLGVNAQRGVQGPVGDIIADAANRYGLDPLAMKTVAQLESSGNPNAKNPTSSAGGLFQFIDSTARAYKLFNKFDPVQASDAAARLMRDNAIGLRRVLGRDPSVGELYLAHQQGLGGARKLLANPGARAVDVVGAAAVKLNGGNVGMTAGEFAALWINKAERVAGRSGTMSVGVGMTGGADAPRVEMNPLYSELPLDRRLQIYDQLMAASAKAEVAQQVQMRAAIDLASTNAPDAIQNTGSYDGPMPTESDFIGAYGVQEGPQRFDTFQASVETSQQVHDMQAMPASAIRQMVDEAAPTSAGNDAALETKRYETLTAAAARVIEAREKDPAGYVQRTVPQVAEAWQNANSPEGFQVALSATAAAQAQLGIENVRLLPDAVADQATATFKDASRPEQERIAAATQIMFATNDPAQRRAIFDQLVESGLSEVTEGAFEAMSRGDQGAARRLFQAAMTNPADLPGKSPETSTNVNQEIQDQLMAEGSVGDIYYGLSDGSADNLLRAQRDAKLLYNAVEIRLRNGEALSDAVTAASKDLYGDVQVINETNAQILLPADEDADAVIGGLERAIPDVRAALDAGLAVDPSLAGTGRAIVDASTAVYRDRVLAEGYFRNAESGFVFIDPITGGAVSDAQGKPIIFQPKAAAAETPPPSLFSSPAAAAERQPVQPEGDILTDDAFTGFQERMGATPPPAPSTPRPAEPMARPSSPGIVGNFRDVGRIASPGFGGTSQSERLDAARAGLIERSPQFNPRGPR